MPKLTPGEIEAFLTEPGHLVRIATVDADGRPRNVPIWYIFHDSKIVFTPRAHSVFWPICNAIRAPASPSTRSLCRTARWPCKVWPRRSTSRAATTSGAISTARSPTATSHRAGRRLRRRTPSISHARCSACRSPVQAPHGPPGGCPSTKKTPPASGTALLRRRLDHGPYRRR